MTTQPFKMADANSTPSSEGSFFSNLLSDIFGNVFNLSLLAIIVYLLYKIFKSHTQKPVQVPEEKALPKLRRDFTVEELSQYSGKQPDGRILIAVNGKVFDVTRGKRFYGPDGPYANFGGRDASRGLATFNLNCINTEYDDLSDLNTMEMDSVREWEIQFLEKYDLVGKLLKPGEEPTNYSDEEEEASTAEKDSSTGGKGDSGESKKTE